VSDAETGHREHDHEEQESESPDQASSCRMSLACDHASSLVSAIGAAYWTLVPCDTTVLRAAAMPPACRSTVRSPAAVRRRSPRRTSVGSTTSEAISVIAEPITRSSPRLHTHRWCATSKLPKPAMVV